MYVKLAYVRALLYLRQSADRTLEELAVTRQREDLLKLAELRRWTVVGELVDNDISAAGGKRRPGFEAALLALTRGEADVLAARDLDRMTRNARDTLRLIEVGKKAGTLLAFVSGTDFNLASADGRTLAGILSSIAQGEIEKKSERHRRAARQAAEQGRRVGGRRPFGFEQNGIDVRTAEADALVQAYDDVLSGLPLARIARDLNDRGLFTPQKTRAGGVSAWTGQTLRNCLLNPRYAGMRSYQSQEILERHKLPVRARLAGVMYAPDGSPVKAAWPALVTHETWRAAATLLTHPGRRTIPLRATRALLTGVARCGHPGCGLTVRTGSFGRNGRKHRTYRCQNTPSHISRKAEPVDAYIEGHAVARLAREDAGELLLNEDAPDFEALNREAKMLRVKLDSLASLLTEGVLTETGVRAESRRLRAELAKIEERQTHPVRGQLLRPLIEAAQKGGVPAALKVWDGMDTDRQRAVVADIMEVSLLTVGKGTRTFRPETVLFNWKR